MLGIVACPGTVELIIDFVFARDHPDLRAPRENEVLYSRIGVLRFGGVSELSWTGQGALPATDATGAQDYGAIDAFTSDADSYALQGGWGRMHLRAGSLRVDLTGPK